MQRRGIPYVIWALVLSLVALVLSAIALMARHESRSAALAARAAVVNDAACLLPVYLHPPEREGTPPFLVAKGTCMGEELFLRMEERP